MQKFKIILAAIVALSTGWAHAAPLNPAIGGYSPVSYFTENAAQMGDPAFAVTHDEQLYYLTSADQVELFNADPDRYRPRHRSCSYSLALGRVMDLDPTNFKIIDDTLLLFHKSETKDARLDWEGSKLSEAELLRRADANLFLIRF